MREHHRAPGELCLLPTRLIPEENRDITPSETAILHDLKPDRMV